MRLEKKMEKIRWELGSDDEESLVRWLRLVQVELKAFSLQKNQKQEALWGCIWVDQFRSSTSSSYYCFVAWSCYYLHVLHSPCRLNTTTNFLIPNKSG
jgi:hypothetical protein